MVETVSMLFAFVVNSPVVVVGTENVDAAVVTSLTIVSHGSLASPGVFAALIAVEHGSTDSHVVKEGPVVSSEVEIHSSVLLWCEVLGNTVS